MKTNQKLRKQRARKQLGKAISEGKGHNAVQQAARKANIEPIVARKFQKALS